ncbi:MAG: ABC transporter ATP-binding protein [Chloroflexaceae bacterium]|jgi:peptide/nickel transport system ATP-binding protein|nr:ABC transporter ATP-binding protein [Chloroflexaceae bacterium]
MNDLLLEVENLQTHFFLDDGLVKAVDGVHLHIRRGRTLAVVGESGCGKSIMARSLLQIVTPPGKIVGGAIRYHRGPGDVVNLLDYDRKGPEMRAFRGREAAMIFQEPMASLSPVYTIGNQIVESFRLHFKVSKAEARTVAIEMLRKVGIPRPEARFDAYPHQLSGGMRQRAMIAMALICQPNLLIADEPTTALDVTTQAQILELLQKLQAELEMAVVMITHDLGVVAEMADDVAVMYLGQVVEQGSVDDIFYNPQHPYTRGLLASIPRLEGATRARLAAIPGTVPHPYARPGGCPFHTRCRERIINRLDMCKTEAPPLVQVGAEHHARCWLHHNQGVELSSEAVQLASLPLTTTGGH